MSARADQTAPSPRRRPRRPGLLKRLVGGDEKRIRRRRKALDARLAGIRKMASRRDLPSDGRAFLLLALGRLEALLAALPEDVRGQELTLSWVEGLLVPLERQAGGLPAEVAPFETRLPTTVAEEERRRHAMSLLEAVGSRLRREREEILESLDEVEAALT